MLKQQFYNILINIHIYYHSILENTIIIYCHISCDYPSSWCAGSLFPFQWWVENDSLVSRITVSHVIRNRHTR